jgi:hypothetical protein
MTTSQEAATASKPKTPSPISLFGPPPLIEGENAADYDELHARVFDAVRPTDIILEIWIHDIMYDTWTIMRLRRNLTAFLTERVLDEADREAWSRACATLPKERTEEEEWAHFASFKAKADFKAAQPKVIIRHLTTIEQVERLITITEGRRNATFREIELYRAAFARALRDKVRDVEEAEFNEVESPAIAVAEEKQHDQRESQS